MGAAKNLYRVFDAWVAEVYIRFLKRILSDQRYFHDEFYGSDHALLTVLKNILRPRRFLIKLLHGQVVHLPAMLTLAAPLQEISTTPEITATVKNLRSEGLVVLPGFYQSLAKEIATEQKLDSGHYKPEPTVRRFYALNQAVFSILADEFLLSVVGSYYGYQPILSELPAINITYPSLENPEAARQQFPCKWHYDQPNQITAHVLLSNVSVSGTRMKAARKKHKHHRTYIRDDTDYLYSDEYVRDHFDVVDCVGPIGTLIILDPNTIHRVELVKNFFRSHLHLNYSVGNDLIPRAAAMRKLSLPIPSIKKSEYYQPDRLSRLQLGALKHLVESWD